LKDFSILNRFLDSVLSMIALFSLQLYVSNGTARESRVSCLLLKMVPFPHKLSLSTNGSMFLFFPTAIAFERWPHVIPRSVRLLPFLPQSSPPLPSFPEVPLPVYPSPPLLILSGKRLFESPQRFFRPPRLFLTTPYRSFLGLSYIPTASWHPLFDDISEPPF